jgi:hypothetical protein
VSRSHIKWPARRVMGHSSGRIIVSFDCMMDCEDAVISRRGSSEGSYPFKLTCNQQEVNPRQNHPRGAVRSVDSTFCRLVLRGHLTIVGRLLTLRWWSNGARRQTATGTSDRRARRHGTAAT